MISPKQGLSQGGHEDTSAMSQDSEIESRQPGEAVASGETNGQEPGTSPQAGGHEFLAPYGELKEDAVEAAFLELTAPAEPVAAGGAWSRPEAPPVDAADEEATAVGEPEAEVAPEADFDTLSPAAAPGAEEAATLPEVELPGLPDETPHDPSGELDFEPPVEATGAVPEAWPQDVEVEEPAELIAELPVEQPQAFLTEEPAAVGSEELAPFPTDGTFVPEAVDEVSPGPITGVAESFGAAGERWGYVDAEGNVRLRDPEGEGRVLGPVRDDNVAGTLAHYAYRFREIEQRLADLSAEVAATEDKGRLLGKVRHMLEWVPNAEALGDFARVLGGLQRLEQEILENQAVLHAERKVRKEELCARAEGLAESTEWQKTADALKALQEEWKRVGSTGAEEEALWTRFRTANDTFYRRRKEHSQQRERERAEHRKQKEELCAQAEAFVGSQEWRATTEKLKELQKTWSGVGSAGKEQDDLLWKRFRGALDQFFGERTRFYEARDQEWAENRRRKEELCEKAEALQNSGEWNKTGEALKALQAEWKEIATAGRAADEALWKRFRGALDVFFNRRTEEQSARREEYRTNMRKKEALCVRAEALVSTPDPFDAVREAKELQAEWKGTGHVPREAGDAVWARFRKACDEIFARAQEEKSRRNEERSRYRKERQSRLKEAIERKQEQVERLKESMQYDQANIARWEDTLSNLQEGRRADEMRYSLETKITDVNVRLHGKQERLKELEASIKELEAQL